MVVGDSLGPYRVIAKVGEGGMGEVYRARDTTLDRDVALKILPEALAGDADRLARFEREARTLAALNHPNIASIYGFEGGSSGGGVRALVMELVEGPTLADRIARGAIPLDEALAIAVQIVVALEAAHDQGIVHRDLKPANIKVRPDGTVKVLDFGLAKAVDPVNGGSQAESDRANSPTFTVHATQAGIILGTAAYMAPEQAKGRPVDRRADVFAFGCVLYEMLTGRRAFDGEDVTEVLGAILRLEPDWSRLPADTPPGIRTLLRLCLEKNPKNRRGSAADIRLDLECAKQAMETAPAPPPAPPTRGWAWAAGGAVVGAAAAAAVLGLRPAADPAPSMSGSVLRYTIPVPTTRFLGPSNFALSPDGLSLAFAGPGSGGDPSEYGGLQLRRLDSLETTRLGAFGAAIRGMAWSPDSRSLLTNGSGLRVTDVATGGDQVVEEGMGSLLTYGVAWGRDRTFLRAEGATGLSAFSGAASPAVRLTPPAAATQDSPLRLFPAFLSDGRRFAFVSRAPTALAGEVCIGSIDSPTTTCLGLRTASSLQVANGALLYLSGRDLLAHPFDEATASLAGDPVRLAADVAVGYLGLGAFSASKNGRLAYRTGDAGVENMTWFDRAGHEDGVVAARRVVLNFDVSRDGRIMADTDGEKLWVTDLGRAVTTLSTLPPGVRVISPALSADGSKVALAAAEPDKLAILDIAGGRPPAFLARPGGVVEDWSPDERWIAVTSGFLVPADGGAPVRFATPPEGSALDEVEFSPDGRWVAYNIAGGPVGATQVFVSPTSGSGERWQVSTDGGAQGRWSPDGREIYYLARNGDMMAVAVSFAGARPAFSAPRKLFATGLRVSAIQDQFHVGPDGRFLVSRPVVPPEQETVTIVVNWPSLLERPAR